MICTIKVTINNIIHIISNDEPVVESWGYNIDAEPPLIYWYSTQLKKQFPNAKRIRASTAEELDDVLQIPEKFIQVCLNNIGKQVQVTIESYWNPEVEEFITFIKTLTAL